MDQEAQVRVRSVLPSDSVFVVDGNEYHTETTGLFGGTWSDGMLLDLSLSRVCDI